MRFACEQCQTKYTIPDERVRGKILKIRCKNCNCQITISEGGVRTARPVEAAGDTIIPTKNSLPALGEGGDATMIGGMGDFFSGPGPAGPAAAPDEWYVSIDGQTAGPIPMQELAQRVVAEDGSPEREIFVWREGFGEWLPPGHVDDVKLAVAKERRNPAQKQPRIATKLGLAPVSSAAPAPQPVVAPAAVGGSLVEENEDATQIGSLSAPIAPPPATQNEISGLALEAVDFDMVTDLPAPPKPKSPPAAAPPKPKSPPAFKPPPPTPVAAIARPPAGGSAPVPRPTPPKSVPPFDITPSLASPMAPVAPPSQPLMPANPGSTSQSFAPPASEEPTGGFRGSAGAAGMGADMQGGGQLPMGMMGAGGADPGGYGQGAAGSSYATNTGQPATSPAKKTSPIILAALAGVMLLGVGATVWVVTRPAKNATSKTQVVDAGPPADAMPAEPEKPAPEAATAKAKSAKDDLLGLTADQRDALLDKNKKAITSCSNKLLKKEPKLAGVALAVEVTISAKGKIDTVEISSTDKDKELDGKAAKCYQKAIKRWKFPKRTDKTAYQIKFGLPL